MKVAGIIIGALAFASAGFRAPGRKGFIAFIPAVLLVIFGGKSDVSIASALGCGLLALFSTPADLPPLTGAGLLALSPALLPWVNPEKTDAPLLLLALAFSLFLAMGTRSMRGLQSYGSERRLALACFLLLLGFAGWMWQTFLRGGNAFKPEPWFMLGLLNCAFATGGWHKNKLGAEILTLLALAGIWSLTV